MTALWSFAAQFCQRLFDALEIARRTHPDEGVDRIIAELRALGQEPPAA